MNNNAKFLNNLFKILKLLNLWPRKQPKGPEKWTTIKHCSFLIIISPLYISVLMEMIFQFSGDAGDMNSGVQSAVLICAGSAATYMTLCHSVNYKYIKHVVRQFKEFERLNAPSEVIQNAEKKINICTFGYIVYYLMGNMLYLSLNLLNINKCNNKDYTIKNGYPCPCAAIFSCRLPFSMNEHPWFEIILLYEVFYCVVITFLILVGILLISCVSIHTIAQLKYLRSRLVKLFEDDNYEEELRYCVQYHNAIIKYSQYVKKAFGLHMVTHATFSNILLGAAGAAVMMAPTPLDRIRYGFLLIGVFGTTGIHSFIGQKLIDESLGIADDLYNKVAWHRAPVSKQKDFLIVLRMCQKPIFLASYTGKAVGHQTLVEMYKTAFSIMTLLHKLN